MESAQAYDGAEAAYDFAEFASGRSYGDVFPSRMMCRFNNTAMTVQDFLSGYEERSDGDPNAHGYLLHDGYVVGFTRG